MAHQAEFHEPPEHEPPENETYSDFLEQYGSLFSRLRNIAEERGADGLRMGSIELDEDANNMTIGKIEETILSAFRNLPAVFEELRLSLLNAPSNSIRDNVENLGELKRALGGLYELLSDLAKNSKTDNAELISSAHDALGGIEELMGRVTKMIAGLEDLLGTIGAY